MIGFMRDCPLRRTRAFGCDCSGDHERDTSSETGRPGQCWVHGRVVGDRRTVLVDGRKCTTYTPSRPFPFEGSNFELERQMGDCLDLDCIHATTNLS